MLPDCGFYCGDKANRVEDIPDEELEAVIRYMLVKLHRYFYGVFARQMLVGDLCSYSANVLKKEGMLPDEFIETLREFLDKRGLALAGERTRNRDLVSA